MLALSSFHCRPTPTVLPGAGGCWQSFPWRAEPSFLFWPWRPWKTAWTASDASLPSCPARGCSDDAARSPVNAALKSLSLSVNRLHFFPWLKGLHCFFGSYSLLLFYTQLLIFCKRGKRGEEKFVSQISILTSGRVDEDRSTRVASAIFDFKWKRDHILVVKFCRDAFSFLEKEMIPAWVCVHGKLLWAIRNSYVGLMQWSP